MTSPASLAVFCGPSLPPEDRIPVGGVFYLPPASRGDVARAAAQYGSVLLIDGVFHHDLAPSPKECYDAAHRARCFGASSLGALRAAECWPYGFSPLGIIARWYIRGVIDGDDEVAVLVDPRTHRALSVPLVNVRYVARLAERRGILSRTQAGQLIDDSRETFYADRTWREVFDLVPSSAQGAVRAIAEHGGDLKRHDARFALRRLLGRRRSREIVNA
jgi:hypothetical protein